jgi:hypothetical protein
MKWALDWGKNRLRPVKHRRPRQGESLPVGVVVNNGFKAGAAS